MSSRYSNDNCQIFPKIHTSRQRYLRILLIKRPTLQKSISTKEQSLKFGSINTTDSRVYSSKILFSQKFSIQNPQDNKTTKTSIPKKSTSRDPDHQGIYSRSTYKTNIQKLTRSSSQLKRVTSQEFNDQNTNFTKTSRQTNSPLGIL